VLWPARISASSSLLTATMNQKSSFREVPQFVSSALTANMCKLDRLARSTRDLLNTLDAIGKAGATFKSLGDAWADTTTPAGKLMLTVLGGLAEYERHLILSRTAEGRTRAKANGVRFGRKPTLSPYQRTEALKRRAEGETLVEIAKLFGVSHMTISRL
jgi:DNA invertase Pin-like site-specific DNA recombinase